MATRVYPLSSGAFTAEPGMSRKVLRAAGKDPELTTVQFSQPLDRRDYDALEKYVFSSRPDVMLRAYGWYGLPPVDLGFLHRVPSATRISVDTMRYSGGGTLSSAQCGLGALAGRDNLVALTIGISTLGDFDFLDHVTPSIRELGLGATTSKKPDLSAITRFGALERLYIERQHRGIEAIARLRDLRHLTLRSISTPDIEFVSDLPHIESVRIGLGGIRNLDALRSLPLLRDLDLWRIRGLDDLNFLSDLRALETLSLQALPQVKALPSLRDCTHLRQIHLELMKGLVDLDALEHAPALTKFRFAAAASTTLETFAPLVRNPAIIEASVGFGSVRRNRQFDELASAHGIARRR